MHIIQQKILGLARERNLAGMTLRGIGVLIGEPDSPQKIKHHLDQLMQKGLLLQSADGKKLKPMVSGLDKQSKLISLPIVGSVNCGEAITFADEKVEEYLKISQHTLDSALAKRTSDLYVLRAIGDSMNRANIRGKSIESGDYVVIDKTVKNPADGDYVVSVIDGCSNIKRFRTDRKNRQIILHSESTADFAPIYINEKDLNDYLICGKVVEVFKKPSIEDLWQNAAGSDALKDLGEMSKEEYDYYQNLTTKKRS
jgi:SOS-response transcriptional repressor LexA